MKHTANLQNVMYAGYHATKIAKQQIFAKFIKIYLDTPLFNLSCPDNAKFHLRKE